MNFRSAGVTITDGEDVNIRRGAGLESRKERTNRAGQDSQTDQKKEDRPREGGGEHLPDRAQDAFEHEPDGG